MKPTRETEPAASAHYQPTAEEVRLEGRALRERLIAAGLLRPASRRFDRPTFRIDPESA